MNVYFFNGLGNHKEIFSKLTLDKSIIPIYVSYPFPQKGISWQDYIANLAKFVDNTKPFCLVGLSFGGLVVTELNKLVQPEKTILISSISCRKELPFLYKVVGNLKLNYLVPGWFKPKNWMFQLKMFGVKSGENKAILTEIFKSSNPRFTKWAMKQVSTWQNTTPPSNMFRIHGAKDRVLPITNFKPDVLIQGGGHIVVLDNAKEVGDFINTVLASNVTDNNLNNTDK